MAQRYVVVDLETTGNSPKKGERIIQFAAVVIEEDQIIAEYSTFIHPEQDISMFIEELTGIDNDMVKEAPLFEEVAERISALLKDAVFVAHNVLFDLNFLKEELERCGMEAFYGSTIDTVELAKIMKPTSDGYKLNQLAKQEKLDHSRPHRADSDAYVTAQLFLELKKKLYQLPLLTMKQLYRLSYSLKSEISELIQECIAEKLSQPSDYDATIEAFQGLAFKKMSRDYAQNTWKTEYPSDSQAKLKLIRESLPQFESREGQLEMMDRVYDSFENEHHTIIEAGTGIGKSLAYLLPAAYFSVQQGKPVVISTYTLQLQEQLLQSEVPKLKRILHFPFSVVLLKGRSNYLSLAKFERAIREKEDNYETALTKMQILVWLTETETGDKDELNLTSGGELFWERLQSNSFTKTGLQKPWQAVDFYERAKAVALKADIIITNHAFLMADLVSPDRLIPRDGFLILDEAHHLERAASKHLGRRLDYVSAKTLLNRLGHSDQKQLLFRLEKLLHQYSLTPVTKSANIDRTLLDFFYEFDQLFFQLGALANKQGRSSGPKQISIRLIDEQWKMTTMLAERLVDQLQVILSGLDDRISLLSSVETLSKNAQFYLNDFELMRYQINELKKTLADFFVTQNTDFIYWMDYTKANPQQGISLASQPITGSKLLWNTFFSRQKSIIMTSATLSVKSSFQFFMNQLGMQDVPVKTFSYSSPFCYHKQVRILVPKDIPDIQSVAQEEFVLHAAEHIILAAEAAKGRMMILFTSHEMLRATYYLLKESQMLQEYTLFGQGITSGSKTRLLKNFQSFDKAILLGTTSFWEGVDVPGEDLSCLVIVRLPFSPPDDPITEARCNVIRNHGKNPFSLYSLPEAILRFRQGFGRLIRTSTDRGVLIVLDRRIMTTVYGEAFRQAIPSVNWLQVSKNELVNAIEEWI